MDSPASKIKSSSLSLASVLARLDALIDWERRERRGEFRNLEPIKDLLNRLGNPHLRFRSVHVTGTKGKGSVCALIEDGLGKAGFQVGRYSSPHVERVTERVTFNGREIQDDVFAIALQRALAAQKMAVVVGTPSKESTWFDVITAAAFLAFAERGIEWAVIEVGIGGRLDSTNIINGEIAVITNIDLEHTKILGATRTAIATDKVGILKIGATLVTAIQPKDEVFDVLKSTAKILGCPIVVSPYDLAGTINQNNLCLAKTVLDVLGDRGVRTQSISASHPSGSVVGAWLLNCQDTVKTLPGRMERFDVPLASSVGFPSTLQKTISKTGITVPVILDGAHVASNLSAVLSDLSKEKDLSGSCVVVFGLGRDKDAAGMLNVLRNRAYKVVLTTWSGSAPPHVPQDLKKLASALGILAEVTETPRHALARAFHLLPQGGWILVTGSLHLIGVVRPMLRKDRIAAPA